MICTNCHHRDVCDFAGKDSLILEYCCDREGGSWRFDRLRLGRMTTDRDALRAELDALRHEVELTNENEHQIMQERNEARAELDRTKGELDDLRELARYVAYPESRFTTQVPFSGDEGRWASSLCKRHAIGNDALRDTFEKGDRA